MSQRECVRSLHGHEGFVRGITFTPDGSQFLTVGDDKTIKIWNSEKPSFGETEEPTNTIINKVRFLLVYFLILLALQQSCECLMI